MEYNNIAYWADMREDSWNLVKALDSLDFIPHTEADRRRIVLGEMIGVKFKLLRDSYDLLLLNEIHKNDPSIQDIHWIGKIIDKKKYLLAKIKYGI